MKKPGRSVCKKVNCLCLYDKLIVIYIQKFTELFSRFMNGSAVSEAELIMKTYASLPRLEGREV